MKWGLDRFANDRSHGQVFLNGHVALGRIDTFFPHIKSEYLQCTALSNMGKYDVIVRDYQRFVGGVKSALYRSNRIEDMARMFPDARRLQARLLFDQSKFEQVLSDYPEQKTICKNSLLAMKKYEEVLERFNNEKQYQWQALIALGRDKEVLANFQNYKGAMIAVLLKKKAYSELLKRYPGNAKIKSTIKTSLAWDAAVRGELGEAEALLSEVGHNDFTFENTLCRYFFYHMLKFYGGDKKSIIDSCKNVYKNKKYIHGQILWYMAAFILGEISEEEFNQQPFQVRAKSRLLLVKAIKAEVDKNLPDAVFYYAEYLRLPFGHDLGSFEVFDRFCEWRLQMLERKQSR